MAQCLPLASVVSVNYVKAAISDSGLLSVNEECFYSITSKCY